MKKIVVVTVTYNSSHLLSNLITSLKKQTISIHKIVVVDNCSTKEHREIINRILAENTDIVEVIWLESNTGGAGGFQTGMLYAKLHYSPDWYWIMDDDAYPETDCLDKLLSSIDNMDNIGFVAPLIWGIDNKAFQLYHHKLFKNSLIELDTPFKCVEDITGLTRIDANAFVGPLVSKLAVESVGVADGKLFIYGDDTEYTYRVTRKLEGYLCPDAIMNHRDPIICNNTVNPKAWWKDYYEYRNKILFIKNIAKVGENICRG